MKHIVKLVLMTSLISSSCNSNSKKTAEVKHKNAKENCCKAESKKKDDCCDHDQAPGKQVMACKLSSPELQKRKATVLESLRKQVLEKKELPNGYAFKFRATDKVIDELSEFIKTEKACCSFFTFKLLVNADKDETWLELTGADGVKEFINAEMGL
jgi:hypothetical protein